MEPSYEVPSEPTIPKACAIPIFARGRDASTITVVDAISSTIARRSAEQDQHVQATKVRLVQTWKGTSPFPPGDVFNAESWPDDSNDPSQAREQFEVGKRYVIFPKLIEPPSLVYTGFCGLIESTPSVIAQVNRGLGTGKQRLGHR